ncbi:MAG: vWA domain-containing protein [Candidatus Nanohaloarchaea archaeon]
MALLLVLTAAGPQLTADSEVEPNPQVKVVQDSSESSSLIERPDLSTEEADLVFRSVNSDQDDFRDQVRNVVDPGDNLLFVSDFQSSIEGLEDHFRRENVSSNVFRGEMAEEHAVRIEGPSKTVIGAENRFEVEVDSTSESPELKVGLGNETLYTGEPPYKFNRSFDKNGYRKIWAEIEAEDEFSENNEYFKTVRVREKPDMASIGPEGGLEQELEGFYSVDSFNSLPAELDYDTLLLKKPVQSQKLEDYIVEGGGLVYTGNDYSPGYLPVDQVSDDSRTDAPVVVLLMDVSQNMGCVSEGWCATGDDFEENPDQDNLGMSIRLAYEIVEKLPGNSRVSLMPYADRVYSAGIEKPRLLGTHRKEVLKDISSIRPKSAAAYHSRGLINANSLLSSFEADGNLLMISNGEIPPAVGDQAEERRKLLREASILDGRMITVGVDSGFTSPSEEGEKFLKELAEESPGGYYVDGRKDSLNFNFSAGGGSSSQETLKVTDSTHFITENYRPQASISDIDSTEALSSSSQPVSTSSGKPFLTTWRYGLGRVAAFSGDNQHLDASIGKEPGLVGRTFSWSTRPEERQIWVEGSRQGDDFKIVSRNEKQNFTRRSANRYVKDLNPGQTGFYSSGNVTYSKNYRPEIERVGYNERKLSEVTVDGRVYTEEDLEEFFEGLESEELKEEKTTDLRPYLLVTVLLSYLAFVGLRKRKGLA